MDFHHSAEGGDLVWIFVESGNFVDLVWIFFMILMILVIRHGFCYSNDFHNSA